jgi:hypothetical protein
LAPARVRHAPDAPLAGIAYPHKQVLALAQVTEVQVLGHCSHWATLEIWVLSPMYVLAQLLADLGPREVQDGAHKRPKHLVLTQVLAFGELDKRALALLYNLSKASDAKESGACSTENRSVYRIGEIEMGDNCRKLSNYYRWSGCLLCGWWIESFSAADCSVKDCIKAKPPHPVNLVPCPNSGEVLGDSVPRY